MIRFIMALAMAALVGAGAFAYINLNRYGEEKKQLAKLTDDLNDLISINDELYADINGTDPTQEGGLKKVLTGLDDDVKKIRAALSIAEDDLADRTTELAGLMTQYEAKKAELEELALIKEKLKGRTPESVQRDYAMLEATLNQKQAELTALREDVRQTNAEVEKNEGRIAELVQEEEERRQRVALNGMEAMVIAINRDYGFVIVNAGSDIGVTPDASLLVQRGVDRIGRLRIVQVDPKVTIADIIPGSVSPGAQIMVRDKVIFENVFR